MNNLLESLKSMSRRQLLTIVGFVTLSVFAIFAVSKYLFTGEVIITSNAQNALLVVVKANEEPTPNPETNIINKEFNGTISVRLSGGDYTFAVIEEGESGSVVGMSQAYLRVQPRQSVNIDIDVEAQKTARLVRSATNIASPIIKNSGDIVYIKDSIVEIARSDTLERELLANIFDPSLSGENIFEVVFKNLCPATENSVVSWVNNGLYEIKNKRVSRLTNATLPEATNALLLPESFMDCLGNNTVLGDGNIFNLGGRAGQIEEYSNYNRISGEGLNNFVIFNDVSGYSFDHEHELDGLDEEHEQDELDTSFLWFRESQDGQPDSVDLNEILFEVTPFDVSRLIAVTSDRIVLHDREDGSAEVLTAPPFNDPLLDIEVVDEGFIYSTQKGVWFYNLSSGVSNLLASASGVIDRGLTVSSNQNHVGFVTTTSETSSSSTVFESVYIFSID